MQVKENLDVKNNLFKKLEESKNPKWYNKIIDKLSTATLKDCENLKYDDRLFSINNYFIYTYRRNENSVKNWRELLLIDLKSIKWFTDPKRNKIMVINCKFYKGTINVDEEFSIENHLDDYELQEGVIVMADYYLPSLYKILKIEIL